jgi:hypothetical protein
MSARLSLLAVLVAAGCGSTPAGAMPPPPPPEATLEVFVDALSVHGEWIVVPRHGRVWRPLHVAVGWQPYLRGEWVWTDDGWFWLTDEPWGWATYHYGRWGWDPALGWFWVPGLVWAPAWVVWRIGDGFVGWAPLYPEFATWWVESYPLVPPHWVFVPTRSFVGVRIELVAVSRARVPALVRSSRPAPPAASARPSHAPPLGGPPRGLVERHVRRPVPPARVVNVPAPDDARGRPRPDAVPVYRPPAGVRPAPARPAPPEAEQRPAPARGTGEEPGPRSGAPRP